MDILEVARELDVIRERRKILRKELIEYLRSLNTMFVEGYSFRKKLKSYPGDLTDGRLTALVRKYYIEGDIRWNMK